MTEDSADNLRFLPVGLDVRGKHCMVVGGGGVGTRKVSTLLRAGANVTVLSPAVTNALAGQIESGRIRWIEDAFQEVHLGGVFLVVAATDDKAVNGVVVETAARQGALACDASSAERSGLIFGALLRRDNVTVAVFSDGRDPAQARRTRDQIAQLLDPEGKS